MSDGTARSAMSLYMRRALELALRGLYTTDPNPRVGCVLVNDGRIVGEGWHERAGDAHAEVQALRAAAAAAAGATAYVIARAVCAHGTHAAVRAGADRRSRAPCGVRLR